MLIIKEVSELEMKSVIATVTPLLNSMLAAIYVMYIITMFFDKSKQKAFARKFFIIK